MRLPFLWRSPLWLDWGTADFKWRTDTRLVRVLASPLAVSPHQTPSEQRPIRDGRVADVGLARSLFNRWLETQQLSVGQVTASINAGLSVQSREDWLQVLAAPGRKVRLIEHPQAVVAALEPDQTRVVIDLGEAALRVAVANPQHVTAELSAPMGVAWLHSNIKRILTKHTHLELSRNVVTQALRDLPLFRPLNRHDALVIQGKSLATGQPESQPLSAKTIQNELEITRDQWLATLQEFMEELPSSASSTVSQDGVILTGGGAQLAGLSQLLAEALRLPIRSSANPQLDAVQGLSKCS